MYSILDKVNYPSDVRKLSVPELKTLCFEIRDYMIDCCSTNPGHLGSSLGAVELIVGIHYVYNTPFDNLVFDVGHQAYAHKIITGRKEAFRRNRMSDGISGFPKRSESPYDVFGAGHASTSISAAIGLAQAAGLSGSGAKSIALIGDGALSGGLAFEGLNNAGISKTDILIVINDNDISIDLPAGGMHDHLLWLTTHPKYNQFKKDVWNRLGETGLRRRIQRFVQSLKSQLVSNSGGDLFEALGFRYFGPIDGNDIAQVVDTLRRLRDIPGPKVLHTITQKGKGFAPAEEDRTTWHAPGQFDPSTGKRIHVDGDRADRYQDVFGETLLELARQDGRIVGVTPAMASNCGMNLLAAEMPERFFDVGIAEEHAATFSAGLAAGGLKPFCNIYSSFSQRAYDQIIHDVALQRLGVVFCFDRGGLVGEDGATHHGVFDIAAYRSVPNVVIAAPRNEIELRNMMYTASLAESGPFIIRYPRGAGEGVPWRETPFGTILPGSSETLLEGEDVAVLAAGPVANRALEAAMDFRGETGRCPAVYNIRYIKPLDPGLLDSIAASFRTVITVEEGCTAGGLHGAVAEWLSERGSGIKVVPVGIPDRFIEQGGQEELRALCGLDRESLRGLIAREMDLAASAHGGILGRIIHGNKGKGSGAKHGPGDVNR